MTGDKFAGFTEATAGEIPEIGTYVRQFQHDGTGADVVFLLNSDAAQTFAIAFRTHPTDSTGVAHVLEHCVLSGSRAYPADKPFVELLKGSLQSYLNASTFADFTIYPAASPHPGDFRNLVDVYLDAVFFPLLSEKCFQREGWRLAADGTRQGVVLNEMKGMYAAPEYRLADHARRSLFHAGPFSHAYGGDPDRIVDLTHDKVMKFHQAYYHPSNALVAYSGVDDIQGELRRLNRVFNHFERCKPHQTRAGPVVTSPQLLSLSHANALAPHLALSWTFPVPDSRLAELAYDVLCEALIGQPFAPLRRALIDAGHCSDVAEGRFFDDTSPPRLSIQLTEVDPVRVADVRQTVRETMEQLVREGFNTQILAGAFNAVEFRCRDRSSWKRPHAVGLLLEVTKAWRLGRNPIHRLGFASRLAELRSKPAGFYENMLKSHLLESPHFTLVTLTPDAVKADRTAKVPSRRPCDATSDSPAPRQKPQTTTGIPQLKLQDLTPDPSANLMTVYQVGEVPLLLHQRQTNGIAYADLAFNLQGLSQLSCAALFARVLLRSGTVRRSAQDMANRIGAETGGLSCEVVSAPLVTGEGEATHLILRARTLADRVPHLFDILGELVSEWQIPKPHYLSEIVRSEINRVKAQILPKAHDFLDRRLRSHINVTEQTDGLSYLGFLHDFQLLIMRNPSQARQRLIDAQAVITCRRQLTISITCDESETTDLLARAEQLAELLPIGDTAKTITHMPVPQPSEAFVVSSKASFVGMAFDMQPAGSAPAASLSVALKYLETGWLWQKLREDGGAYGVLCRGDPSRRICTFLSYRDPHLLRTLDVFETAGQQISHGMSEDDLTRAIIAKVGSLDRPLPPSDSGLNALTDWLRGWTPEHHRIFRADVLATGLADLQDLGKVLSGADVRVIVLGRKTTLSRALAQRPKLFSIKDLPGG